MITQAKVSEALSSLAISGVELEQSDEDASWALDTALPLPLAQKLCARLEARGVECSWAPDHNDSELALVHVTIDDDHVPERKTTAEVDAALSVAGYDTSHVDDTELILSLTDGTQGDTEEVDGEESLAEVRSIVEPLGYQANWTGNGNTNSDGESTSDVRITPA